MDLINIYRKLKRRGLTIKEDAYQELCSRSEKNPELITLNLEKVIKFNKSCIIDKNSVINALNLCKNSEKDENNFKIVNAFQKDYFLNNNNTKNDNFIHLNYSFVERYKKALEIAKTTGFLGYEDIKNESELKISSVEDLFGVRGNKVIFGMLTESADGKCLLEDLTGSVEVYPEDFKIKLLLKQLFTWGSFVGVRGMVKDEIFIAKEFLRISGKSIFLNKNNKKEHKYNLEECKSTIIILSDVYLNDNKTLENLMKLFNEFENSPPIAFILSGNFLKNELFDLDLLEKSFINLSNILNKYENIKLINRNLCLAPNREKQILSAKLDTKDLMTEFLAGQMYLVPFTNIVQPLIPNYWEFLSFNDNPDLIFLCDSYSQFFTKSKDGMNLVCPGVFGIDGSFVVWYSDCDDIEKSVQFSKVK